MLPAKQASRMRHEEHEVSLIYFIIMVDILVCVHELGHFIMAKQAGVQVEKFSIGMGAKLVGYKKGNTEYIISALPIGGYVKMTGKILTKDPQALLSSSNLNPFGSASKLLLRDQSQI